MSGIHKVLLFIVFWLTTLIIVPAILLPSVLDEAEEFRMSLAIAGFLTIGWLFTLGFLFGRRRYRPASFLFGLMTAVAPLFLAWWHHPSTLDRRFAYQAAKYSETDQSTPTDWRAYRAGKYQEALGRQSQLAWEARRYRLWLYIVPSLAGWLFLGLLLRLPTTTIDSWFTTGQG